MLLEREKFRVSDGASPPERPVPDEPVSDAEPCDDSDLKRYLDDLSPETRRRALKDLTARCDQVIPQLKRVIVILQEARFSGVWSGGPQLGAALLAEPRFVVGKTVDHIAREEKVTVLGVKGELWRVRTLLGKEGWVHSSQLKPRVPIELSSKPGVSGEPDASYREDLELGPRV